MLLRKIVRSVETKPMDEAIVRRLSQRPGLVFMEYKNMIGKSLQQLLPKAVSGVLVLIMDNRKNSNVGHFVLLMKHPRSGITFFDPYGFGVHQLCKMTKNHNHLERLLLTAGHRNIHDNRVAYQKRANDIQTCGRHVITRWNCASMNAKEYKAMMHLPGFTTDELVTLLTLESDFAQVVDKSLSKG